jgi:signal transduction histidine kinase
VSQSELLAKVKELAARLAEAEAALKASGGQVPDAAPSDARSKRLEQLGARTESLAHDLNNVFAPILMAASLLKDKVSDEKGMRMLTVLESNAERGTALVRQIQGFVADGEPIPALSNEGMKGQEAPTTAVSPAGVRERT